MRSFCCISILFFALFILACETNREQAVNQSTTNTGNSNVNTAAPVNRPPTNQSVANASLPVTMPLLDAMFVDETFLEDAKREVQLTDDEAEKLRSAARDAVLQLSGGVEGDDARSTKASVEKARKEIEKILGSQRTETFLNLARNRWGGSGEELIESTPNAIPTDTRVVVNAPAYRMDLFKDGRLVKTYKIGIGYPEFPLPTGLRRASEIIFNPTWTPPDEPWVTGKVQPGKKVEAGSKLNPLGPIKIPIGLPSLIHGGKDPSRLGTFASHGCVGLTNATIQDFAFEIASLAGQALTMEEIKENAKKKTETKNVKLTSPLAVELRYETIVVTDGKITIYRDVYERGTNTEENLRKLLGVYGVTLASLPEAERAKLSDALKQMAADAQGQTVVEGGNTNSSNTNSTKVTRNIKGRKEMVIQLAALRGKGYPAPVGLKTK